jgi:cystathionine gamma-synthase
MSNELSPSTVVVHAGRPPREPDAPLSVPPVLTSTYVAGGPTGYGRYGNPSWTAFEDVLGALEGGRALAFASGMGAVSAVLDLVPVGGRVVVPSHAYSGVLGLLDQHAATGRLSATRVDIADTAAVLAAGRGAALVWVESPTNPALEVADLAAIIAAAHEQGAVVAVDNTFATPLLQRPFEYGADVVVHSATKYLAGHSDVLLGAVVTRDDGRYDELAARRRNLGAIPGAMDAWLALRGMRTLSLRIERAQHNAAVLASRLAGHPRVERVRYPGLPADPGHELATRQMRGYGAILAIEVAGGAQAAQHVCERTRLWVHATSLGGVESTLERRRRWASESPTIPENLIRLSVGIEDADDLWNDLVQALEP